MQRKGGKPTFTTITTTTTFYTTTTTIITTTTTSTRRGREGTCLLSEANLSLSDPGGSLGHIPTPPPLLVTYHVVICRVVRYHEVWYWWKGGVVL